MSRRKIDWHSRGRDAFTEGRPCIISDGRIKARDRAEWLSGYHYQEALNRPPISEQERNELVAEIQTIKDSL